jgi:hypothetical protein
MSESTAINHLGHAASFYNAEFRFVSPQEAADLVENHNPRNRSIRKKVVERYTAAIVGGRWLVTGQPIIIDWNGDVLDGQHRLIACRDAGVAIFALVVTGIDPDVMPAIDKNTPRMTRDTLGWAGRTHATERSSILRPLWGLSVGIPMGNTQLLHRLDDIEILKIDEQFGDVIDKAVPLANRLYKARGLSKRSWGVAIAWMIHEGADETLLEEFVESVVTGVNLSATDPRYQFRQWCDRARGVGGQKRTLRADELVIAVLKAWNYWIIGKTVQQFAVRPSEPMPNVEAGR